MSTGTPVPAGKYKTGDRCFARLKGHPWWPSKIKERIAGKVEAYKVYFYGTYDEGTVKLDMLMEYNEENLEKLKNKPPRSAKFLPAIAEIEQNMEFDNNPVEAEASTEEPTDGDEEGEGELLIDEKPPMLTKEIKTPKQVAPKKGARAISPDIAEEKPRTTPVPKKGGRVPKSATPVPVVDTPTANVKAEPATPTEPSGPQQPEIVSRSGRKIKPKRFADDFDTGAKPEGDTPPASKRAKRVSSVSNKAAAQEDTEKATTPVEAAQPVVGKRKSAAGRQISTPKLPPPPLTPKAQPTPKVTPSTSRGPPPLMKGKSADSKKQIVKGKPTLQMGDLQGKQTITDEKAPILQDVRLTPTDEISIDQGVDGGNEDELKQTRYKFTNGAGLVEDTEQEEPEDFDEDQQDDTCKKIPIRAKNETQVELYVNTIAKENIKTQKGRAAFEATTKKNVERIKSQLQGDKKSATQFLGEIVKSVGPKDEEFNGYAVARLKENVQEKIQVLKVEGEMIELMAELVVALSIKQADADSALDLLDRIAAQKVDTVLLRKHAEIVDVLKQLRRYEGNLAEWNLTEEQKADFTKKAEQIREKSDAIYQKMKSLFRSNPPKPFPVPVTVTSVETPKTAGTEAEDSQVDGSNKEPSESVAAGPAVSEDAGDHQVKTETDESKSAEIADTADAPLLKQEAEQQGDPSEAEINPSNVDDIKSPSTEALADADSAN